jgi:hypothetical protein
MLKVNHLKILVSSIMLFGIIFSSFSLNNSAYAEENNGEFGQFESINESEAKITLNNGYKATVEKNGEAKIVEESTGEVESLPSVAKDKNGEEVVLVYEEVEDGLEMYVVKPEISTRGFKEGLKCGLGTAGGAGTVGLAGFGVGGPGGAVVGAVAGGMSGAAASCF